MATATATRDTTLPPLDRPIVELPLFASWANLVTAAVIYVVSNPGRTNSMGVITEPILKEFDLSRTEAGEAKSIA